MIVSRLRASHGTDPSKSIQHAPRPTEILVTGALANAERDILVIRVRGGDEGSDTHAPTGCDGDKAIFNEIRASLASVVATNNHESLDAGALHTVTEPALLAVEPPSRHLSAAARADATVRVTPRGPDGAVRMGAAVTAMVTAGDARIEQPPTWDGTAFVVRLRAPSAPGSSVVEVRIDGAPVAVRPRVWWD